MPGPNQPQNQKPKRQGPEGQGGPGGRGPNRVGPPGLFSRGPMSWIFIVCLFLLLLYFINPMGRSLHELNSWDEFREYAKRKAFDGPVIIEDNRITGTLKDSETQGVPANEPRPYKVFVKLQNGAALQFYLNQLYEVGQPWKNAPDSNWLMPIIFNFGPILVIVLLIYFVFIRSLRGGGGGPGMLGSFGRSRHKVLNKEHSSVTLKDVAGIEEAKEEVGEIIEFLKNPKKFQRLGGRVPRGVLLIGEPGCGKTLLAKAVAGEADVPFFSISGSDFVEMFVGVGASRVRDLFKQAKDSSPCIIFLDEIDAVGRRRTYDPHGGSQETSQTLNAILVEMDGFDTSDQVIVMAATNRADVLDPALTRPGRFDRQITVPLPDIRGRMEILEVHARKVKLSPSVDLEKVARGTPMFSGADLAAIINEAAIGATLQGKDFVEQEDLEEARDKVKWGRAHKSRKIEEEERVATAYHEAGHAVLQKLVPHADPLHKVTIIPRGNFGGATISLPEKDRYGYARRWLLATMRVNCGGRIAEERKTDDVSSGAAMDIRTVTQMARHMILDWGMSPKLGFVHYSDGGRDAFVPEKEYSEDTAKTVDEEVKRLIDEAYADAQRIISENWDKVEAIADALLRFETLSGEEVERLMKGEKLTKSTIGDILRAEQGKPKPPPRQASKPDPAVEPPPGAMPNPA